jgi:hypothetical protein
VQLVMWLVVMLLVVMWLVMWLVLPCMQYAGASTLVCTSPAATTNKSLAMHLYHIVDLPIAHGPYANT